MKVTMINNCAANGDKEDNNGDVIVDFYEECNNVEIVDDYEIIKAMIGGDHNKRSPSFCTTSRSPNGPFPLTHSTASI